MNMKKSFGMAACAMLLMMACTGQKGAAQGESGAEDSLAADTAFAASDTLVFKGVVYQDSLPYKVKIVDYSGDEEPYPYTVETVADTWEVNTLWAVGGPAEAVAFVNQWLTLDAAGADSYSVHTAAEVAKAYEALKKEGVTDVRSALKRSRGEHQPDDDDDVDEDEMEEMAFASQNEYSQSISVMWQTKNVLTLWDSGYDYSAGAAHGMPWGAAKTFDLKNLRILTLDDIITESGKQAVLKMIFDQLEDEYADVWDMASDASDFPGTDPALDKDGVRFDYGAYELGAYAMGMPSAVIPYEKIKKYLTPGVKELLGME